MGFSEDYEFIEYNHILPVASSWNKYPTKENPSRRYKFTSYEINLSADKKVINRETYSLLDWLGDVGGLIDALRYLCKFIIGPVTSFSLQATLLSKLFRQRPSDVLKRLNSVKINKSFFNKYFDKDVKNETLLFSNIRHDFQVTKVF